MRTHLNTTRNPMSEARRQHVHGSLLPMERPAGEPSFAAVAALLIVLFVIATLLIAAVSAPQSSGAVEQPASRSLSPEITPGVEAVGGEGEMA